MSQIWTELTVQQEKKKRLKSIRKQGVAEKMLAHYRDKSVSNQQKLSVKPKAKSKHHPIVG